MPQNGGGLSNINQPSGWRKATAGLAVAEQHAQAGERAAVPKTQAFVAVKRVGAHIGLKAGDMLLLDTLGAFTQAQDWEEGQRPIVWASNSYLMEQTGFSLSALKRHARRLAEIGVIAFKDSPNGKRWGHRDADGRIIEAYGFDLSPLSARAEEFERLHAELRAERELCQRLKRQITVARRMIRARIEAAQGGALRGPWTQLSSLFEDLLDRLPRRNMASEALARLLEWFRELQERVEPYQGVNNFLLTMRTVMAGHSSPFWMTLPQANALDAKVRKGEKSSVVVYYGQSRKDAGDEDDRSDRDDRSEEARIFRFQKSYRVFNACQIEGLPDSFYPDPEPAPEHPSAKPIPHMQAFFDAIDITTVFTGTEAYYLPPVDKVFMPSISRFENPRNFYGVWAHELAHATKARHRLNRDYGLSRFGNTAYAREEIVAELTSVFLGQTLGFTAHTLEMNAAYLHNWLRVLRSDKNAIFKHAADAQRASDYLIARSEAGRAGEGAQAA
ncbi:MAG: hypothetical protein CMI60_15825 [Parvibaculum sp.]|nr:hypothetical protein [Parvibaculum sp.]